MSVNSTVARKRSSAASSTLELAHEPFDLRQHRVVLGDPEEVLVAGELDEPRSRDPRSELPHPHDGELHVLGLGDHQGRDVDREGERDSRRSPGSSSQGRSRLRGSPPAAGTRRATSRVARHRRGSARPTWRSRGARARSFPSARRCTPGTRHPRRPSDRPSPSTCNPAIGAVRAPRDRPLGVRRGEQHRHRAALRDPEHHRTLRSRRVHHGAHVVHPCLHRWQLGLGDPIREPHAALVEQDQPAEGRERREEASQIRLLPHRLDVAGPAHHPHEVHRSIADDLVGDVHPAGCLGEPRLRHPHALTTR